MEIFEIVSSTFNHIIKVDGTFQALEAELSKKIEQYGIELLAKNGINKPVENFRWEFTYFNNQTNKDEIFICESAPTELAARVVYFYNHRTLFKSIKKLQITS
jgi:hypothetical protein